MIKIEILVRQANGKEYPHPGVWNFTDIQVNQQTDTLIMRATLPNPERQLIDGTPLRVPGRPALLLHVALHAAQHGGGKALEDLRRAIAVRAGTRAGHADQ